jgi:thiaminase (transcriptional activator TenA)
MSNGSASTGDLFSQQVWQQNQALITAIRDMPYNRELAAGTLPSSAFQHYIVQDSLYLRRYSRALAVCAAKATDDEAADFFANSARVAIAVEKSMHAGFLHQFGLSEKILDSAKMSPVCQAYTDFLIAACYERSYAVAVAAILPCFWVYEHVGREIARVAIAPNPYQAWIDTYSDEGFAAAVRQAIGFLDAAAASAGDEERQHMAEVFELSTLYEYQFWDSAYQRRDWPKFAAPNER